MTVVLRRATEADAGPVALLLTELGYPSIEAGALDRLSRSLSSSTSCCLVAQAAGEVVGLMCAELVPYFPTGTTICRVTALVVNSDRRSHGVGEILLAAAADFAREHHCSGLEVTSAERRVDAHRFYQRLGFSRTGLRFFRAL
jgi:N-acetylglutamate synthase-like GNAT family acetyltransferase